MCSTGTQSSNSVAEGLKRKLERLKKQQSGLREMRAMGDISREEFQQDNQQLQQEIVALEQQLADLDNSPVEKASPINMDKIKAILNQWVDLADPVIPDALIEQFILQVVVRDDNTFNWTLNLEKDPTGRIPPREIARRSDYEQRSDGNIDTMLSRHITDPQTILAIRITEEQARDYCKRIGQKFFAKKWTDKTLIISI